MKILAFLDLFQKNIINFIITNLQTNVTLDIIGRLRI